MSRTFGTNTGWGVTIICDGGVTIGFHHAKKYHYKVIGPRFFRIQYPT